MTIIVNGLSLPLLLIELIESGRWKRPTDVSVLAEMTGVNRPEEFSFCQMDAIIRETGQFPLLLSEGLGHGYGLTSSNDPSASHNPSFLDVYRAVIIAVNWDEDIICLDYTENLNDPKVVCNLRLKTYAEWKVIAPTFDAFAERLGL